MIDPVTFTIRSTGRIEAMLGKHLVGVIEPSGAEPYYQIHLPTNGAPEKPRPLLSGQSTRRLLLHRLAQWHRDAGAVYAPIAVALERQAEMERDGA